MMIADLEEPLASFLMEKNFSSKTFVREKRICSPIQLLPSRITRLSSRSNDSQKLSSNDSSTEMGIDEPGAEVSLLQKWELQALRGLL